MSCRWCAAAQSFRARFACCLAALVVATAAAQAATLASDQPAYRFVGDTYALAFHADGHADLHARQGEQDLPVGSIGTFAFAEGGLRSGSILSVERSGKSIPPSNTVHVENVATALQAVDAGFPQVTVSYRAEQGAVAAVWTLMPRMVRATFHVAPPEPRPRAEGPATLDFTLAEGAALAEQIKPARWHQHPQGGVPLQRTAGMADRFSLGGTSLTVANDRGLPVLYDRQKQQLHICIREIARPWRNSELEANVVFAIGQPSPDTMPLAVAAAGRDQLMMRVDSPHPFFLGETCAEPLALQVHLAHLAAGTQRIDLEYATRSFDGRIIGRGAASRAARPLEVWQEPIGIASDRVGPVYLEIAARIDRAAVVEHVCLGVLPVREFADAEASRFGVAAYRGGVGPHTELRTEEQILALLGRLGVRWLRASEDHALAQRMGFFTWYANSVFGPAAEAYKRGEASWINELTNRENYIAGNLQRVLDQRDLVFEFTNEWNSWGGEGQGVLAQKYARDWLVPIKRLRDKMAPQVKLAGCVIANGDLVFLDKVHEAGGWDQFEILAFHAMGEPRAADFDDGNTYWSYLATLRRIHEALRRYGRKELWMTEFYAPSAPNSTISNNERVAAESIPLMCAMAVAADVRGFMLYCLDDHDGQEEIKTASQVGEPAERESYFGLVRRDWQPKAGLWAYQGAAYYLDGATFAGDIRLPQPWLHGLLFQGCRGRVALLWSRQEGYLAQSPAHPRATHRPPWQESWSHRTPVELTAADSTVTVVDCVGHARPLKPDSTGKVIVELTGAPIYVLGAAIEPCRGRFSEMFKPSDDAHGQAPAGASGQLVGRIP